MKRIILTFFLLSCLIGKSDAVILSGYSGGALTYEHIFTAASQGSWSAANPKGLSITCAAGTTLLVLGIQHTEDSRTGGVPTFNGVAMTQVGSEVLDADEVGVEMWYMINPPTGASYSLSVPNDAIVTMRLTAARFSATSGYTSVLDQNTSTVGDTATPSLTRTTTGDGAVCITLVGSGHDNPATGRSDTLLYANDEGVINFESQYNLQTSAGEITMDHTFEGSENIAMIMACFKVTP